MLRIEVELQALVIKEIKITGDFFVHPERDLFKIEKILKGVKVSQVEKTLEEFLQAGQTQIIGFSPNDLQEVLSNLD